MSSSSSLLDFSSMSSSLKKELLYLILQFLDEEKLIHSVHRLEQECGIFFNMKYFEEKVLSGEWDEVEKYLSGFTKLDDNKNSMEIYFEIKMQKYLEVLDRQDKTEAFKILVSEMNIFADFFVHLYEDLTQLLTLKNIREHVRFTEYGDTEASRGLVLIELKKFINANPVFSGKLAFPTLETSKLMTTLISQRKGSTSFYLLDFSSMSLSLKKELLYLILQFLDEQKLIHSVHRLEQECGIYFNIKHFEEKVLGGEWDEVEKYLSGFTKLDDNKNSMEIYFEIKMQKYLEALDRQDKTEAFKILVTEMNVFADFFVHLYEDLTELLTLKNIREHVRFTEYGDTEASRGLMLIELKKFINANPVFSGKLAFPTLETSKLMTTLISQRKAEKQKMLNDVKDRMKHGGICRMITLPEREYATNKVACLLYTHKGDGLLALGSNGTQKLWKWARTEQNPTGKANANHVPYQWEPESGLAMRTHVPNVNLEQVVPCIDLAKNDVYAVSAIGGRISLFNLVKSKVVTTCMPAPAATSLSFNPQDNNIIAIGTEDSTIVIYNIQVDEVILTLRGHQKNVTGLAFSSRLNLLISSGADAQVFRWHTDSWKRNAVSRQLYAWGASSCDTRVEFHSDSVRVLVSNETQLAVYDASKMDLLLQWIPQDFHYAPISSAAYSCKSLLVYALFCDGNVGIFDADTLIMRYCISPYAYLSRATINQSVYPLVIATHPHDPNQFSIGLSDGSVKVMEPP